MSNATAFAELVELATKLIGQRSDGENHTVAAAARNAEGQVFAGVNAYHFTGGPCAELVVLGMAASASSAPLTHIVAVGDAGRGVLAPCGRCRQVLFDYFPAVRVLVPAGEQGRVASVTELLPATYDWHAQSLS